MRGRLVLRVLASVVTIAAFVVMGISVIMGLASPWVGASWPPFVFVGASVVYLWLSNRWIWARRCKRQRFYADCANADAKKVEAEVGETETSRALHWIASEMYSKALRMERKGWPFT